MANSSGFSHSRLLTGRVSQPKTKNFARIRAALFEESTPIDSEAHREAEVIRQVRESDSNVLRKSPPALDVFATPNPPAGASDAFDDAGNTNNSENQVTRSSVGPNFFDSFEGRYCTPPPPSRYTRLSSVSEDDAAMEFTPATTSDAPKPWERPPSSSSSALHTPNPVVYSRKRRRDDELDPNALKRRAVSPSVSNQSSPVLPQSPAIKDFSNTNNIWGPPRASIGSLFPERHGSQDSGNRVAATGTAGTLKRVGLQGMTEASDGFMNMSIE